MITNETSIRNMMQILMQLDEKSLILLDSGAKLLVARQNMEKEKRKTKEKPMAVNTCHQLDIGEYIKNGSDSE